MEIYAKLDSVLKTTALYIDFTGNFDNINSHAQEALDSYKSLVEEIIKDASKENYVALVETIQDLRFCNLLYLVFDAQTSDESAYSKQQEIESVLGDSTQPLVFSSEDLDFMVCGSIIAMQPFYSGAIDENVKSDPDIVESRVNKPLRFASILTRSKYRQHVLNSNRCWSTLR